MLIKPSQVFALQQAASVKQMVEPTTPIQRINRRSQVSYSNEEITPEMAITSSGVIAIMTLLSQDTASMPLILYARKGRNKFRATDHPYYRLMHDQPNPEMSAMTFRELIVSHLLAWGNFYAQIIIDKAGQVIELWPLRPDRMMVQRIEGKKVFVYRTFENKTRTFTSDEILHVPGWGFDGLVGYSRIAIARNAIGLAISTEKYGSKFFANDARPGVVYQHPSALSDTAYKHLNQSFDENKGADNAWLPKILEEGMTIKEIGIPNDDAQYLQTRSFQLAEINRILGPVPPHMIGDVEKSTSWGTGIDSQEQGYVNHTLRPLAVRIEQPLNSQLLLPSDREQGYFFEHLFDGLLRGDIATRYSAYVQGINNGFMTRNEARERENLNPRIGLDEMVQPLNVTTVGSTPTTPATPAQQNALRPVFHDAALRVVRREMNDLRGAVRRHLSKGQDAVFAEWKEQFYSEDMPAFIRKQFAPIVEAHDQLFGGDGSVENVALFFSGYIEGRKKLINGGNADQLEQMADIWLENLPDVLTENVMQVLNGVEYE
jgi:HK97 family phage portal protein